MILVYSHKITNRVKYIFETIFTDVLKVEVQFTSDKDSYINSPLPKIAYTNTPLEIGLFIQSSSLLFETGIREQEINVSYLDGTPFFFKTSDKSIFNFDPFAASFYLVSRYEEYLPQIRDEHDRFMAKESLAFKSNFLNLPLVNIWADRIAESIEAHYPDYEFPQRAFEFTPTLDIDNAFAYKHKGFLRISAGIVRSIVKTKDFAKRVRVLLNKEEDPYDTFNYQFNLHKKYSVKPIYFFLLGDYAINDKNIPVKNKTFQSLIKSVADYYPVGIHPSYNSNKSTDQLKQEINRLKEITHKNISLSRQHFLKLNLPETYQNLIEHDIKVDYTMGYAEQPGFRASMASPFFFFDLESESKTKLKIVPFCVMEATFKYYLDCSPEEAIKEIEYYINTINEVKGNFVCVWHNESLSNSGIWKGWRKVYEYLMEKATTT